jgi:hypothetical protein
VLKYCIRLRGRKQQDLSSIATHSHPGAWRRSVHAVCLSVRLSVMSVSLSVCLSLGLSVCLSFLDFRGLMSLHETIQANVHDQRT